MEGRRKSSPPAWSFKKHQLKRTVEKVLHVDFNESEFARVLKRNSIHCSLMTKPARRLYWLILHRGHERIVPFLRKYCRWKRDESSNDHSHCCENDLERLFVVVQLRWHVWGKNLHLLFVRYSSFHTWNHSDRLHLQLLLCQSQYPWPFQHRYQHCYHHNCYSDRESMECSLWLCSDHHDGEILAQNVQGWPVRFRSFSGTAIPIGGCVTRLRWVVDVDWLLRAVAESRGDDEKCWIHFSIIPEQRTFSYDNKIYSCTRSVGFVIVWD